MDSAGRVLLAGETWFSYGVHQKGFAAYTTGEYAQSCDGFVSALRSTGWVVDHISNHDATSAFPTTQSQFDNWDVIVLSDIAADTLLLTRQTFDAGQRSPNRLRELDKWVAAGGSLLMIGGYLSFSGIEGKARYQNTPLQNCLPVTMLGFDDRVECPEGAQPAVVSSHHPVLEGLPTEWPWLLGYNRVIAKPDADVLITVDDDPLLAVCRVGAGRTAAFTSDCSPHWGSPEFMTWHGYAPFWHRLLLWLSRQDASAGAYEPEVESAAKLVTGS
jgi:uncharacterized membrane protein